MGLHWTSWMIESREAQEMRVLKSLRFLLAKVEKREMRNFRKDSQSKNTFKNRILCNSTHIASRCSKKVNVNKKSVVP